MAFTIIVVEVLSCRLDSSTWRVWNNLKVTKLPRTINRNTSKLITIPGVILVISRMMTINVDYILWLLELTSHELLQFTELFFNQALYIHYYSVAIYNTTR